MRTVSLISLILAALAVSSIAAHAGSWCAHYRNGGNNCGFHSFEQCQAAVSGVGGILHRGLVLPDDRLQSAWKGQVLSLPLRDKCRALVGSRLYRASWAAHSTASMERNMRCSSCTAPGTRLIVTAPSPHFPSRATLARRVRRGMLAAVMAGLAGTVLAQAPGDFFKDKSLNLYIGYSVGGAYDLYARLLARHLPKHLPHSPAIVPRNMEGAGSLRLANWLYGAAPRDGTAMGTIGRGAPFDKLLARPGIEFEATEFSWIGSANDEVSICVAWHTSGVSAFTDLMQKELIVGAAGAGSDDDQFPRVINGVLGTKMRVVSGYPGGQRCGACNGTGRGERPVRLVMVERQVHPSDLARCGQDQYPRPAWIVPSPRPSRHPAGDGFCQDRRAAPHTEADSRTADAGPAIPRAARHSAGEARCPASRLCRDDEGPAVLGRCGEAKARSQASFGRAGRGRGEADLCGDFAHHCAACGRPLAVTLSRDDTSARRL